MESSSGIPVYKRRTRPENVSGIPLRKGGSFKAGSKEKRKGRNSKGFVMELAGAYGLAAIALNSLNINKTALLISAIAGGLLGLVPLMGEIGLFGYAYFASLLAVREYGMAVAGGIGSAAGVMAAAVIEALPFDAAVSYIVRYSLSLSLLLIAVKRLKESGRDKGLRRGGIISFLAAAAVIFAEILLPALCGGDWRIISGLTKAALAGMMTLLFQYGIPIAIKGSTADRPLKSEEMLSLSILLAALAGGSAGIQIYGASVGRALAGAATLAMAYAGGSSFGAAAGITMGIICSMIVMDSGASIALLGFSGLLSGFGSGFGRIVSALIYWISGIIISSGYPTLENAAGLFAESAASGLLFLSMPGGFIDELKRLLLRFDTAEEAKMEEGCMRFLHHAVSERLKGFSKAILEIGRAFQDVPMDIAHTGMIPIKDIGGLMSVVNRQVCCSCQGYEYCWEMNFYKTYRSLLDIMALIEINPEIEESALPESIRKRCMRISMLMPAVQGILAANAAESKRESMAIESRSLISSQLLGVSEIVDGIAERLELDPGQGIRIKNLLERNLVHFGLEGLSIGAYEKGRGRIEIEVGHRGCGGRGECRDGILPLISKILGRNLAIRSTKCGNNGCRFVLNEVKPFSLDIKSAALPRRGSRISGDTFSAIELEDGRVAIVLSDGMGAGPRAAMESRSVVSMLGRMVEAGFDEEFAVRTVNSVLLLRSRDETFATIDMAVVDLYTGEAEISKIGSCSSFVIRGEDVILIKSRSLPAGILSSIEIEKSRIELKEDDILVMMTDGVLDCRKDLADKEEWVARFLKRMESRDPDEIANMVLNKAMEYSKGTADDDMTLLVAKVVRNRSISAVRTRYSAPAG